MSPSRLAIDDWVREFVTSESAPAKVDAWTSRITDEILRETPEVADDAALVQLARTTVRAHWIAYLSELTEPPRRPRLVKPAVELATIMADRNLHLATLFKVYRLAQQATWTYVTEVVAGLPTELVDQTQVLVYFWSRASAWIDSSVTASVDVYQAEREKLARSAAARRIDVVSDVLAGRLSDIREASAALGGYAVSGFNTAIVLYTDDPATVSDLDVVALRLATDLGSRHPLTVPPGGRELWCWVGTRAAPDLTVVRAHEELLRSRQITVCVGTPAEGLAGFALSHREARAAHLIATRSTRPNRLTLYPDVEVLSLMSGSEEAAARFTIRTLGALADDTETAGRLRETLSALIEAGTVEDAAKALVVHKNTVRYRLGQAEEILGYRVTQAPPELGIALRYYDTFLAANGSR